MGRHSKNKHYKKKSNKRKKSCKKSCHQKDDYPSRNSCAGPALDKFKNFINGDVISLNSAYFENKLYLTLLVNGFPQNIPNSPIVQNFSSSGFTKMYLLVLNLETAEIDQITLLLEFNVSINLNNTQNFNIPDFQLKIFDNGEIFASFASNFGFKLNNSSEVNFALPNNPGNVGALSLFYFGNIHGCPCVVKPPLDTPDVTNSTTGTTIPYFNPFLVKNYLVLATVLTTPLNFDLYNKKIYFASSFFRGLKSRTPSGDQTLIATDSTSTSSSTFYGYWDFCFNEVKVETVKLSNFGSSSSGQIVVLPHQELINYFDDDYDEITTDPHDCLKRDKTTIVITGNYRRDITIAGVVVADTSNPPSDVAGGPFSLFIAGLSPDLQKLKSLKVVRATPDSNSAASIQNLGLVKVPTSHGSSNSCDPCGKKPSNTHYDLYLAGPIFGTYNFCGIIVSTKNQYRHFLAKLTVNFEFIHLVNPNYPIKFADNVNMIYLVQLRNDVVMASNYWIEAVFTDATLPGSGSTDLYLAQSSPAGSWTHFSNLFCKQAVGFNVLLSSDQHSRLFYFGTSRFNNSNRSLSLIQL